MGGTKYRNTTRKIGKFRHTVSKIDEIPIPQLDLFLIGPTYLKLHQSSVFFYLDLYSSLIDLYSLLCFVLQSVLTCMRQESANEQCRNTMKGIVLLNTFSQKAEKSPQTAGLDDTAIRHVKI